MSRPSPQTALALYNRFGFGPRPGDLASVVDPRAALHDEVVHAESVLVGPDTIAAGGLMGTPANAQATAAASEARRTLALVVADAAMGEVHPAGRSEAAHEGSRLRIEALRAIAATDQRIFRSEALARLRKACNAPIGFSERLVAFWSNHFCVSTGKGELARAIAGSFEREAIRPFVFAPFADMLVAVVRHPAMLTYLDNAKSVGPGARANRNDARGLNENLAREVMELHTLGVAGGYTQSDVAAFARVLTGWTVAGRDGRLGDPGSFVFNPETHAPGDASIIGRIYPAGGYGQAESVLNDLAHHPATARHLASKLVRHFVADDPPAPAVDRIAGLFQKTEGDLRAVSLALTELPDAWTLPLTKVRSPYEFLVAVDRLLERPLDEPWTMLEQLKQLGMPLWEPGGPNGFPDTAAAWGSPENLRLRLDLSAAMAAGHSGSRSPQELLEAAFGAAASPETRSAVAGAESREQAVALILMAPEFQRR